MRYAIIDAGRVLNIIEADQTFADTIGAVPAGDAAIGYLWDGTEFVAPTEPAPTVEDFDAALTAHLDATAQAKGYDNRITCALRAGYVGPFQAEGQAFATWMDACNWQAYQVLAGVQAGDLTMPTVAEFIADLPEMVWPT